MRAAALASASRWHRSVRVPHGGGGWFPEERRPGGLVSWKPALKKTKTSFGHFEDHWCQFRVSLLLMCIGRACRARKGFTNDLQWCCFPPFSLFLGGAAALRPTSNSLATKVNRPFIILVSLIWRVFSDGTQECSPFSIWVPQPEMKMPSWHIGFSKELLRPYCYVLSFGVVKPMSYFCGAGAFWLCKNCGLLFGPSTEEVSS